MSALYPEEGGFSLLPSGLLLNDWNNKKVMIKPIVFSLRITFITQCLLANIVEIIDTNVVLIGLISHLYGVSLYPEVNFRHKLLKLNNL